METVALKGLGIGLLFALSFVGGSIPLLCIGSHSHGVAGSAITRRVVSLLNSAAAGIFLSIALVHLLPEVAIIFDTSLNITHHDHDHDEGGHGHSHGFDWAGFTAGMGFLLVVFVEQVMMLCLERSEASDSDNTSIDRTNLVKSTASDSDTGVHSDYGTLRQRSPSDCKSEASEAASVTSSITIRQGLDDLQPISSFRAIILLVSLTLHSIFEGLALGLQLDKSDTVDLLIAISIHKGIESFTVLLRFAQLPGRTVLKWSSLVIFSLASPLGIAIGIPLADPSVNADALLVNGILQGLATGTFMFVTFVELLPVELAGKNDRLLKYLCLLSGFGLMCGLTQI
nr:zinc transporter ZIP1-like [Lytechinus pictus]